jgi:hypothetical protein
VAVPAAVHPPAVFAHEDSETYFRRSTLFATDFGIATGTTPGLLSAATAGVVGLDVVDGVVAEWFAWELQPAKTNAAPLTATSKRACPRRSWPG